MADVLWSELLLKNLDSSSYNFGYLSPNKVHI